MRYTPLSETDKGDLGFGSVVARQARKRLINRDGAFNVRRTGLNRFSTAAVYQALLIMSWGRFLSILVGVFLGLNAAFAAGYLGCGPGALRFPEGDPVHSPFLQAFFFSVHTLATIGYGHVSPASLGANLLVVAEAATGLFGFAIITGLLFARFSRPSARILFSEHALIMPYRGITAFAFRIANARKSEIIELHARVILFTPHDDEGRARQRFYNLTLERDAVSFMPLTWTLVHPIDEASPLYGLDEAALHALGAEFLVLLTGLDETFSQQVHTRSSYKANEVVWNARFAGIFEPPPDYGDLAVDVRGISRFDRLG